MKKRLIFVILNFYCLVFGFTVLGQVGIGTTNPLNGTSLQIDGDAGVLINRVSLDGTDDTSTIAGLNATQEGLMVYNTNTSNNLNPETDVAPGFYFWDGGAWNSVEDGGRTKNGWVALSDANTSYTLNFVNSPDLTDYTNFTDIDLDFTDDPSDSMISSFAPDGYDASDFYDSSTGRITPISTGDAVLLRLQFDAVPLQNNGVIVVQIDIGATPGTPGIIIFEKSIPLVRGGNRNTNVSETILIYQLGTFLANGGKIRMAYSRSNNTSGTTCDVSNFGMVLTRLAP